MFDHRKCREDFFLSFAYMSKNNIECVWNN